MKRCSRILAFVLGMAGMTTVLAAQGFSAPSPDKVSAGCHEHERNAPRQTPPDHACCVTGPESAILRSSCAPQPALQGTLIVAWVASSSIQGFIGTVPRHPVVGSGRSGSLPLRL